ncbi:MAG: tryptophan--tRNA ligase [Planctomycetes bacterium]|nr:tryptophan--tRNA ligase [Planctomycetota bacterium]
MATHLSGIQPSGLPHLGNYFGAIRQHIELPEGGGEHFYFIADYHALTTNREAVKLRESVREVAVTYLALGLDTQRATFFRQSDVPEVCELAWLLSTVTGMGLLERAVSYRDKVERGIAATVGLFTYPALMSADILAYDSNLVPVGVDQQQHVEIARDMAQSFNATYGETFVLPKVQISPTPKVPGIDGQKMSKSYGNSIWIFETGKPLKKLVGQILTDSRAPEEPKDPAGVLLVDFLRLFVAPSELAEWEARIRRGGEGAPGYGHLKMRIVECIEETFRAARARRAELLADAGEVERVLRGGADRARARACATRDRALRNCGLR